MDILDFFTQNSEKLNDVAKSDTRLLINRTVCAYYHYEYTLKIYVTHNLNLNTVYWNITCDVPFNQLYTFHPFMEYHLKICCLDNDAMSIGGIENYSFEVVKLFELISSLPSDLALKFPFITYNVEQIRSTLITKIK